MPASAEVIEDWDGLALEEGLEVDGGIDFGTSVVVGSSFTISIISSIGDIGCAGTLFGCETGWFSNKGWGCLTSGVALNITWKEKR